MLSQTQDYEWNLAQIIKLTMINTINDPRTSVGFSNKCYKAMDMNQFNELMIEEWPKGHLWDLAKDLLHSNKYVSILMNE